MKVLLIEPPSSTSISMLPPITLPTLKGFINNHTSHEAKILDLIFHGEDWQDQVLEEINKERPDIIGFSLLSFNYKLILSIARFIKQQYQIPIIAGGVHAILTPAEVLSQQEIDIVCLGEGEYVLKELLDNHLECSTITGIWYKKNGTIIKNAPRELLTNLDLVGYPDFDDFDIERCLFIYNAHLPIMTSRGCPYSCSYCNNHALRKTLKGTYVRFRSVEHVIEEIDLRIKQYYNKGLRYFYFFDDTFILNTDFVLEFCRQFKEKGFHRLIKWNVNIRANLVTDDLMRVMKDAGCYQVRMGIETANQFIRNTIYNRDMDNQEIMNAVEIIKKNNLQLRLYFMIGAPLETVEMMQESLDMADALHADEVFFALLYPLPGTDILKLCENEHVLDQSQASSSFEVQPITKTKHASSAQIQKFLRKVRNWQMKQYIKDGITLRGPLFIVDCLKFLFFYKQRYRFEMDQLFRWNVQRYKLQKVWNQ
ncbi:MAG: B12-binding domain-containing radical SAM protein [Candidatus Thermoplasmatota archaeon]|nr:B12-binding domain-containing radical SAM protein [Candidatus Thermoplasmatota archaeon]